MTAKTAIAANAAVAALYVELVEAGILTAEAAAQSISRASEAVAALGELGEEAVPLLDGLAVRVRRAVPKR